MVLCFLLELSTYINLMLVASIVGYNEEEHVSLVHIGSNKGSICARRALLFQRVYPQGASFDTPPKMPPKER